MAVVDMTKILIASHKSESDSLLSALQESGLIEILESSNSNVGREFEDLATKAVRPRKLEEQIGELDKDIAFLEKFRKTPVSLLVPKVPITRQKYHQTIDNQDLEQLAAEVNTARKELERLETADYELNLKYQDLTGWTIISTPLEELDKFENVKFFIGTLPPRNFDSVKSSLDELEAVIEVISTDKKYVKFVVAAIKSNASEVQKVLRASEYEAFVHVDYHGTISEILSKIEKKRSTIGDKIAIAKRKAEDLAYKNVDFQILYDFLRNKADAAYLSSAVPASESVRFYEGWIKTSNLHKLDVILEDFSSTNYNKIDVREDEDVPVAIENPKWARPFEAILSLYGSPKHTELDPTTFMAPFFAIFFGLCLTDAGYGMILVAASLFLMRKFQGDKKFFGALLTCSLVTVVAGAMTGGWFGTLIYDFAVGHDVAWLKTIIEKMTWFDPLVDPMTFLVLSLACGYIQIMFGLAVGCWDSFRRGDIATAVVNKLCWILLLNSLIVFGAFSAKMPPFAGKAVNALIFILLIVIGLFSVREGKWGTRIAGGLFELFGIIFYLGDLLSYLRLMALGLATAGVAMAINIMADMTKETPLVGWLIALVILAIGHTFNLLQSALGAFVHTLRLQFVEYFPKFISGGGTEFKPFEKKYKYVHIEEYKN